MANDVTCPWCGSQCTYSGTAEWRFSCGSLATGDHPGERTGCRTQPCKDRELIALRNQLATVTAERDAARAAILSCGNGSDFDWNVLETLQQLDELRRRIDEAPVGKAIGFKDWGFLEVQLDIGGIVVFGSRVRLVRDDQPEEATK